MSDAETVMLVETKSAFDSSLNELAQLIERVVQPSREGELFDAHRRLGPLWALRSDRPTAPGHALYTPMLCVIAQGAKQLLLGDECHVYDRGRFLLNSVALPAAGQVIVATPARPCLWVMIELDPALVESVIVDAGRSSAHSQPQHAMEAGFLDQSLLDATLRLVRLLESPQDFDFLAPLALREIVYRLLRSNQGARLQQIALHGAKSGRVVRAIEWLRQNFDQPLSIEALARQSNMSVSALHHHFKTVTSMSPLQFQKQIRLQEAKRLMVSQDLDAASAGLKVGYEDASYFSRDYRRFFGDPPRRHIAGVRGEVTSPQTMG